MRDKTFGESKFGMNDPDVVEDKRWLVSCNPFWERFDPGSLNA